MIPLEPLEADVKVLPRGTTELSGIHVFNSCLSFILADSEKGPLTVYDDNLCRICMDAMIDCVLLECGHMVTCTKCGKRMNECPICRQYVVRAVHVFKS